MSSWTAVGGYLLRIQRLLNISTTHISIPLHLDNVCLVAPNERKSLNQSYDLFLDADIPHSLCTNVTYWTVAVFGAKLAPNMTLMTP